MDFRLHGNEKRDTANNHNKKNHSFQSGFIPFIFQSCWYNAEIEALQIYVLQWNISADLLFNRYHS